MSLREELGQVVRAAWVKRAAERGETRPSHLAPWEECSEEVREDDRQIGEAVARACAARINADTDRQVKEWEALPEEERPSYGPRQKSPAARL